MVLEKDCWRSGAWIIKIKSDEGSGNHERKSN